MPNNKQYLLISIDAMKHIPTDCEVALLKDAIVLTPDASIEDRAKAYAEVSIMLSHDYNSLSFRDGATSQHAIDQLDKVGLLEWVRKVRIDVPAYSGEELLSIYEQSKNL